jgi:transcriptional regulator with XRE-family HTH domain
MSQQSLAVSAGLSVSIVSQIEQGRRADPRLSTIEALATALGVGLDELVGRKTAASRPEKDRQRQDKRDRPTTASERNGFDTTNLAPDAPSR